jgi:hypothetical protein
MTLAAVKKERIELVRELIEKEVNFARWIEHPSSSIIHHESSCCDEARLWFMAYARSMEIGSSPHVKLKAPTWLSQLFTWGPSKWPISWCELVKEKVLDCGAFAALAREVFAAQGHEVYAAQALLSYNEACTDHWQKFWQKNSENLSGVTFPWIGNEIVYHEVCLIVEPDSTARIYDSTFGQWYEPRQRVGFAALMAVRSECPRLIRWGDKIMSHGEWVDL